MNMLKRKKNSMFNCLFSEANLSKNQKRHLFLSQKKSNNVQIVGPTAHKIEIAADKYFASRISLQAPTSTISLTLVSQLIT
jgi:hypothetical protein